MEKLDDWLRYIDEVDSDVFLFINSHPLQTPLSFVASFLSSRWVWFWVLGAVLVVYRRRCFQVIVPLTLIVAAADVSTTRLLKPAFGAPRPCKTQYVRLYKDRCGGSWRLPSGHAAIGFAVAGAFRLAEKRLHRMFLVLASLVGISRIILGVHQPLDSVLGAGWGYFVGWSVMSWELRRKITAEKA